MEIHEAPSPKKERKNKRQSKRKLRPWLVV